MEEGGRVRWRRNEVEEGGARGRGNEDRGRRVRRRRREKAKEEEEEDEEGGVGEECLPPLNLLVLALNMIQMLSSLLFCPPSSLLPPIHIPRTTRTTILPFLALSSPLLLSLRSSFLFLRFYIYIYIYIYISIFFLPSFHFHEKEREREFRSNPSRFLHRLLPSFNPA